MHNFTIVSRRPVHFITATSLKIPFSNDVQFCGYTVPHPAESKMHFRIQMHEGRAVDALKRGLEDLVKVCDYTVEIFNEEMLAFVMAHDLPTQQ